MLARENLVVLSRQSPFCGTPENFLVWSMRFEGSVSMSGCLGSLLTDIEVAVGDTTKDTQYFVSQGLTPAHIRSARVAWIRLTERMSTTDLLDKVLPSSLRGVLGTCFAVGFCRDQLLRRSNGRMPLML